MGIKRRDIIALFESNPDKEISFEDLVKLFKIATRPRKKLMPHLQSLVNKGILCRKERDKYILAGKAFESGEKVIGEFIKSSEGYGFLALESGEDDLYMSKHEVAWNGIMHGDVIRVNRHFDARRGRYFAKFIEFVSRRDSMVVGKLVSHHGAFAVQLRRTNDVVMIQRGRLRGGRKGDWVEVEIKKWPKGRSGAYGEVVRTIDADVYVIIKDRKLRVEFSPDVTRETEKIREPKQDMALYKGDYCVDEKDIRRRNLTSIPTVTIDEETAMDFDDAISYEKVGTGHRLYVSIADVSHYVSPGSPMDKEAGLRTTSIYFPGRAISMLPPALSNNVCCLRPERYRYTLTIEILFDEKGMVKSSDIYPSVIRSSARLTYAQVQKIIDTKFHEVPEENMDVSWIDPGIKEMLKGMSHLYRLLRKNSERRGTIMLGIPEADIRVNEKGDIESIKRRPVWGSHCLIEEFMISANIEAAKRMKEINLGVYRIHEKPDPDKLKDYSQTANSYKVYFDPNWERAGELSNYLKEIEGHPAQILLNRMLLRSLKKAKYSSAKDVGHFALALKDYSHFTSPIRRYPDLMVHRIIKSIGKYDNKKLKIIAEECSRGEVNAVTAERDIIKMKQARYLEKRIGRRFEAEVSGFTDYGMFVQLKDVFIEGYLPFSNLGYDYFIFDPVEMAVKGRHGKTRYKLGDDINVIVASVDVFEGKIEFRIG